LVVIRQLNCNQFGPLMIVSILKLQVDLHFELSKHLFEHVGSSIRTRESMLGPFFFFWSLYIIVHIQLQ
jgi:hypothetical protein